jgi:hypothetical protein
MRLGRRVGHMEQDGSPAPHSPIPTVVAGGGGGRGLSSHLLHRGQVDDQVEQIPDWASSEPVLPRWSARIRTEPDT